MLRNQVIGEKSLLMISMKKEELLFLIITKDLYLLVYNPFIRVLNQRVAADISETEWKREWFAKIPKYPRSYWELTSNCKEFFDKIAMNYNIQTTSDWNKISY